jgi:hypothetical protein
MYRLEIAFAAIQSQNFRFDVRLKITSQPDSDSIGCACPK